MQQQSLIRHERKFLCEGMSLGEIEWLVKSLPEHFIKSWPDRMVNNVYFDNRAFHLYRLSSEGISNRKKIRIRWYGDTFGENIPSSLEVKSKNGLVVEKLNCRLGNLTITADRISKNEFTNDVPRTVPLELRSDLRVMKPVLVNRYMRRYYTSTKLDIRITIDSDLEFALPRHTVSSRFSGRYGSDIILELKYPTGLDEHVPSVTQRFPFRLARLSKYVQGLGLFFGEL